MPAENTAVIQCRKPNPDRREPDTWGDGSSRVTLWPSRNQEVPVPAGYVIAESIRPGAQLEGNAFTLTRIERYSVDSATLDQPSAWTMIHFEFPEDRAESVANALAAVLDTPGWYTNFDTLDDKVVIFPGRVFRYPRGDEAAQVEAEAYATTLGIPAQQLDW
jgi:hypothetical protein